MVALTHYGVDGEIVEARIIDVEQVRVEQGDNIVFLLPIADIDQFKKVGNDIKINFHDGEYINVKGFFDRSRTDVESVLTFKDNLYTASELVTCFESKESSVIAPNDIAIMHRNESEHMLKLDGSSTGVDKASAFEGTPFIYHFTLDEAFPEDAIVKLSYNNEEPPEWLNIEKTGPRKYTIRGIPEKDDVGENDIVIQVLSPEGEEYADEETDEMLEHEAVHEDLAAETESLATEKEEEVTFENDDELEMDFGQEDTNIVYQDATEEEEFSLEDDFYESDEDDFKDSPV